MCGEENVLPATYCWIKNKNTYTKLLHNDENETASYEFGCAV